MLTVKLDPALEVEIEKAAALAGTSKSEFVRRAVKNVLRKPNKRKPTPYELGKDLFGKATGSPWLSQQRARDLL